MDRRRLVLFGSWAAALLAVLALHSYRVRESRRAPVARAPRGPVHDARDRVDAGPLAVSTQASIAVGAPSMFRGDRRHTGRSPFVGPAAPRVRFRVPTEARISAQAVVDREGRIAFVSHDHLLRVIAEDGTLVFARDLGDASYATPFVDAAGNVYAGSDGDTFVSFDRDGKERFRIATNGDLDTGIVEGPDGTLFFAAGRELWAVQRDGTVRFRHRANAKLYTTPAVADDGTIYVGSQDDRLLAIAPDGRLVFAFPTRGDVDASPAIADDGAIVFGSDDRHVYCVGHDGRARWSIDVGGMVRAPAAFARDGTIYVSVFGPRTRVVALSPIDGSVRWEFELGRADSSDVGVASGVLVDREGSLYVGGHDDFVYSLTPAGALRFAFETNGDVDASPTLTPDGTLLVGGQDGTLYALR